MGFAKGFCELEVKNYKNSAHSLTQVVGIDQDHFRAWNNLAACHLHLNNTKQAFHALAQAVRLNRESWKIWENYLTCAVKLEKFTDAMTAVENISKHKKRDKFNPEKKLENPSLVDDNVLKLLTNTTVEAAKEDKNSFLITKMTKCFETLSCKDGHNPLVWSCYADVSKATGKIEKEIKYREKQFQCLQIKHWYATKPVFDANLLAIENLIDAYLREGSSNNIYAGKLLVKNFMTKASKHCRLTHVADGIEKIHQLQQKIANFGSGSSLKGNKINDEQTSKDVNTNQNRQNKKQSRPASSFLSNWT